MTDKISNNNLDIFDFIAILWKKKYKFLISFTSSIFIISILLFFFKNDYTNYSSKITFQLPESYQPAFLPFDKTTTEIMQLIPTRLSPQNLYFEFNSQYYENTDTFNNHFDSIIKSKNLNKVFSALLPALGNINSSTYEIKDDLLIIFSEAGAFGRSLNYDDMRILREIYIDYYQIIIENIKKEKAAAQYGIHEVVGNYLNDQIKAYENDIEAQEKTLVELYKKIESFNNLGDRDAYWNNFLFVSNKVTKSEQDLLTLRRSLYELNGLKHIYNDYVSNYEVAINIVEYQTEIISSESLINNNNFLVLIILIISLIIAIFVIYIESEISQKRNQI